MTVVVDASVVIRWLLQDPQHKAGTDKATQLMQQVTGGGQPALQPPHWLAEVGALLVRETPHTAADDITMLSGLELPTTDDPLILRRAVELAIRLKQHVSDTFYHAVALETPDATLVTADERYLKAARAQGQIIHLLDWT